MDIQAVNLAFASLKTAIDITTAIKGSGISFEKAEQNLKFAELVNALAETKLQMAEIKSLLGGKDEKIKELEKILETKGNVIYEAPYYWETKGDKREGPFCQHCYDKEKKLIRLQKGIKGFWRCQACCNTVKDKDYVKQSAIG